MADSAAAIANEKPMITWVAGTSAAPGALGGILENENT
jgi:hypothetical protein